MVIRGLRKVYGDPTRDGKVAVADLDLTVARGSFFGLVGPNGAGKSTTLKMATGLLRPDGGSVTVDGLDVWSDPGAVKARIGVVPEDLRLFERLTGRELLEYTALLRGFERADAVHRADQLLDVLGAAIVDGSAVAASSAGDDLPPAEIPEMVADHPTDDAPAGHAIDDESAGLGKGKLALIAVGVVALSILGVTVQRWALGDTPVNAVEVEGTEINFGAPAEGCDIPIGGTMNPSGVPDGLVEGILGALDEVGGLEATGCPLHSVETWQGLHLQEFAGGSGPAGWVITTVDGVGDDAPVLWYEASLVSSLRRTAGGDLISLGGVPTGNESWQGHPTMTLSEGGVVIAHKVGGPAFWVPGPAVDLWRSEGGPGGVLGLPMTDVNYIGGLPHQDYEGGFLEQRPPELVVMELIDDDALQAQLDDLPRVSEGILRTFDSTAWWIDADGVRHWIPDGDTWVCLGGEDVVLDMEVDGWVIGTFPAGENATC